MPGYWGAEQPTRSFQAFAQLWRLHPWGLALVGVPFQVGDLSGHVLALAVDDGELFVAPGCNAESGHAILIFGRRHQICEQADRSV
jgi:hypothetical protein